MCLASLAISHQRRTLKGWTDQCRRESFYYVLFCQNYKSLEPFSGSARGNHVIPQEMDEDDFILVPDENDHFIFVQGWKEEWDGKQGVFKAKPKPVYTWYEGQP